VKVTVDCKHGRFTVHDNDRWIGRALIETGVYSEREVELLCSLVRDGDVVIEAGANIGQITVPLAKAVGSGRVHAFEPQPQINDLLVENVAQNGPLPVHIVGVALSDDASTTVAMAKIDWDKGLLNSGGAEVLEPNADQDDMFVVDTHTLDSMQLPRVDLMKVDVEGHELKVLKGAEQTIRRLLPTIYVENDRPEKSRDLIAFLINDLDYRCWWHFPDLFNANEPIDGGDFISHNMLCVHASEPPPVEKDLREVMSEHDSGALASLRLTEKKAADGFVHRNAPPKRANEWACVVRLGGVGDNLIASSVLPHLKRKWGHVEVIAAEPQHVVFENNPHIDKLTMLPQGYPNWEDGVKWQEHWLARSKEYAFFANLSHTCESLLAITRAQTPYYWPASMRRKLCAQNYIEAVGDVCEVPHAELEPGFYPTEAESAAAEKTKKLVGGNFIGWVLSGTRIDKVWPPTAGVIARLLKDTDLPIIMLGAPGKDFELAKEVQAQVKVLNGSDRNLHLALSTSVEFPNWPIRRVLAQALAADVVVTPDTGPAWAVAQKPMRKIVLLSHASQENITKGWRNTLTLHADPSVACWPCHLLIDRPEDCERLSGRKVEPGVACISSIKPDAVIEAVRKAAATL
jgi:FkbM family methyltransferase